MGILEAYPNAEYFGSSNTTNKILYVLEERRPSIILLEELDKLPIRYQNQLLGLIESGKVKVVQQKKSYEFEIPGCKIFATANEHGRLSKPLQSRFRKLFLKKYSETEFIDVAVKVLPKVGENLARYIGSVVYKNQGDVRDVIPAFKYSK